MKKILTAMLTTMLAMMLCLCAVYAEGGNRAAEAYKLLDFGYYYKTDTGMTSATKLVSGEELYVKASLEKLSESQGFNTATLIAGLYDDGRLIDADSQTLSAAAVGVGVTFDTVKLTLPQDISQCTVEAFIWTDWFDMNPLAQYSEFGSDNANVHKITISGYTATEFDPNSETGEINMPFFVSDTPKIEIECEDLGTKVQATYANGILSIVATAQSGTIKNYTYTVKEPTPTCSVVLEYKTNGETVQKTLEIDPRGLENPEYVLDGEGNKLAFGSKWKTNATWLYTDHPVYYAYVPDGLKGAVVFTAPRLYNATVNSPTDYKTMVAHVTLNKSATFYFPAWSWTFAKQNGAVTEDSLSGKIVTEQLGNYNQMDKAQTVVPTGKGQNFMGDADKRWAIKLVVPEGVTEKTFDIYVCGSPDSQNKATWKQYGPAMFLKWIED